MKKIFFSILIFVSLFLLITGDSKAQEKNQVRLYLFYSSTCPHCHEEIEFLDKIKDDHSNLEIRTFMVNESENKNNLELFKKVIEEHELSGGVPVTVIGDKAIVGYNNEMGVGRKIIQRIGECSSSVCESFLDEELGLEPISGTEEDKTDSSDEHSDHRTVRIFNRTVCLDEGGSLCFLGGLLGLADGINPCMFSVLTFLLVYLMGMGSSKKALKAGVAFVITTFFFYLFFMYGLIKIIDVLEITTQVRFLIAIFSFVVGLIMIKDFFFYGKGISLEIPQKAKPLLEKFTKKGTVVSAVILALLASLVELPCTSGIPLAYVSILSARDVAVLGYLIIYNLLFIVPLLVIVFGTIFVWKKVEKVDEWKEKSKKYMRLTAGILLLFLSIAIYLNWF